MKFLLNLRVMSNATKAQIVLVINALLGVAVAFHVVFTQTQVGAMQIAANAVLSLFVGATYTQSSKRESDAGEPPAPAKK